MNDVAIIAGANSRIYAAWATGRLGAELAERLLDASDGPMTAAWRRIRAGFGLPPFDFDLANTEHRQRLLCDLPLKGHGDPTLLAVVWLMLRLKRANQRIDFALIDRERRLRALAARGNRWGRERRERRA